MIAIVLLIAAAFIALLLALSRIYTPRWPTPRRTEALDLSHLDADAVRRRLLINTLDRR